MIKSFANQKRTSESPLILLYFFKKGYSGTKTVYRICLICCPTYYTVLLGLFGLLSSLTK